MKVTDIALFLLDNFGMDWAKAMGIGSDLVYHQGAAGMPQADIVAKLIDIGRKYVEADKKAGKEKERIARKLRRERKRMEKWGKDYGAEGAGGIGSEPEEPDEPPVIPGGDDTDDWDDVTDEVEDEEYARRWDELRSLVKTIYGGDRDEVDKSYQLIDDILSHMQDNYGEADAMRAVDAYLPDLPDIIKSMILALYKGSGYSRTEGGLPEYKESIRQLELAAGYESPLKWWT